LTLITNLSIVKSHSSVHDNTLRWLSGSIAQGFDSEPLIFGWTDR